MANQKIFCNTPWYETHIYWDGSFGICCQENYKLYSDEKFNVKNMSLSEWFNSEPVREFRKTILGDLQTDICKRCYQEENAGGNSKRHRGNQKSVIFTRTAFDQSYLQSPGYPHFELSNTQDGITDTMPIDLHIDLGNYCNLACKMCSPRASTVIATQMVKWGFEENKKYLGVDWTKDRKVWDRFLNEIITIPKLKNIHFMGGETLLTSRLEELVDFAILHKRFDLCFSFVSNGTVFNERLMNKLKLFTRVGIEISIETTTAHNDYVRQGSVTTQVLDNIDRYLKMCNNSTITVTLRPAISALTVGYYHTLLEYALNKKLLIKSLLVTKPRHFDIAILPKNIKNEYLSRYQSLIDQLTNVDVSGDYNESNPENYINSVKAQLIQIQGALYSPTPKDQTVELQSMISECSRWDQVYKFDARKLYPEFQELFEQYGY